MAFSSNACASAGRLRGAPSPPLTNASVFERGRVARPGVTARRLVEHADLDGVGAERIDLAGGGVDVDEGVRARRRRGVEPVDQVGDRAVGPVAVVLDLDDADDVGVERDDGRNCLGPLAVELGRLSAPRHSVGAPPAPMRQFDVVAAVEGVEVVQQVHAGHPDVPPTRPGAAGRGLAETKSTAPPSAFSGRRR